MKKLLVCIAVVLLVLGCMQQNDPIQEEQSVALQFMKPASIDVVSAKCRVSADDMDTILTYLSVSPTMISGEVPDIPYGDDRLFEIMCYNSSGNMNYYGFALVDISSLAPTVNITLNQVDSTADVSIIGTFGDEEETEEKIVFSADWNGSFDIYIMDTDGTNIRQLTSSAYDDRYPQLSPDRSKVSFHRNNTPEGHICYIVDVQTLELEPIGLDSLAAQCVSWHPTDNTFIFHSAINGTCDIFKYNADTEEITPLVVNDETNWVPVYSGTGAEFTYYAKKDGMFRSYIVNADGSNRRVINPDGHPDERLPHINPVYDELILFSGRYYAPGLYNTFGLYITDRESGNITELLSTEGVNESWPNWSPDGEKVIYERNYLSNYGIYVINRDGSGHKAILDTPGDELYPHWR